MDLSLSYICSLFIQLSEESKLDSIEAQTPRDKFIVFLNNYYFKEGNLFKVNYNYAKTEPLLSEIEEKILYSSIQRSFKVINVRYTYNNRESLKNINLDIKIDNIENLYQVLSILYLLIKGYSIEENDTSIIIKTPSNNIRTINWNQGWYCDCKSYEDRKTCLHVKAIDIYLKHRINLS